MSLLVAGLVLAVAAAAPAPARPGLIWQGAAVHPGCLRELRTALADARPVVAAVDLEGCARSNRYAAGFETDGTVLRYRDPSEDRGSFQYEHLGTLATGVEVVRIGESGGGSGFFQSLLFLRIEPRPVLEDGQARRRDVLVLVGSETLGDRAEATVGLAGDTVTIRRREFRGAAGRGPEEVLVRRPQ